MPALQPEGIRFESTWSHCVMTLEKLLTNNCLWGSQWETTSVPALISSPGGVKANESALGQKTHESLKLKENSTKFNAPHPRNLKPKNILSIAYASDWDAQLNSKVIFFSKIALRKPLKGNCSQFNLGVYMFCVRGQFGGCGNLWVCIGE